MASAAASSPRARRRRLMVPLPAGRLTLAQTRHLASRWTHSAPVSPNTGGGNRTHMGNPPEDFRSTADPATSPIPDKGHHSINDRSSLPLPYGPAEADPD